MVNKSIVIALGLGLVLNFPGSGQAESLGYCVPAYELGKSRYGPFDYMDMESRRNKLPIVEQFHFTPNVESLRKGESGTVPGDLSYTLKSFPNHHRALYSMMRYQLRNPRPKDAKYDAMSCYFQRALEVHPEDAVVYHINGIYLHKNEKYQDALVKYLDALRLEQDSSELHYNLGLVYFDLKDYKNSLLYAQKAYKMNYLLPGLKDKLKGVGYWKDK